jgi:hypothetical protein
MHVQMRLPDTEPCRVIFVDPHPVLQCPQRPVARPLPARGIGRQRQASAAPVAFLEMLPASRQRRPLPDIRAVDCGTDGIAAGRPETRDVQVGAALHRKMANSADGAGGWKQKRVVDIVEQALDVKF